MAANTRMDITAARPERVRRARRRGAGGFRLASAALALAGALALAADAWALTRVIVLDQGRPVRLLSAVHETREEVLIALGELAFKSEFLLEGSPLRTLGAQMTCDSCHPDGGASARVFFEGLSDKPGNLDVTNRAISLIEDNIYNPINVPSIVGARHSAPFGREGIFDTVEDFTLFAIANEFAGGIPSDLTIEALVAYQDSLAFPDNPLLGADGRLTEAASAAARRGEDIFHRPFPGDPQRSCAACHRPDNYFLDGSIHEVNTGRGSRAGKAFETPTLLAAAATPPYLHDGRFDTLGEAGAWFADYFGLALDAGGRADLAAYLEAVGAAGAPGPAAADAVYPETAAALLEAALEADDWMLTRMVTPRVTTELDDWRGAAGAPGDAALDLWIRLLRRVEARTKVQDFDGARAALAEYRAALAAED